MYSIVRRLGTNPPAPDYTKWVQEVFQDVTLRPLEETGGLHMTLRKCVDKVCR